MHAFGASRAWRRDRDGRGRAERGSGDHVERCAVAFDVRQRARRVMMKARRVFFVLEWQRHPTLNSVRRVHVAALRMRDAFSGDHPVHVAGHDLLLGADAVAMHDLAFEQIRDGRETDVRMRRDVHLLRGRSHVIEEHERTDVAPLHRRERAAHGITRDVAHARDDDHRRRVHGAVSITTSLVVMSL